MSALLQFGRYTRSRVAGLLCGVPLLAIALAAIKADAQNPASPQLPAAAQTPAVPPPQKRVEPEPPGQPSMMPRVPGRELDRVVAIVNGDLILDSDVDEERRFAAFDPYRDASARFTRERAIERLINRDLIRQQIKLQPQDEIPDADVTKEIEQLRRTIPACQRYNCGSKAGWDRFLADQGFTEATLFARWKLRMETLEFISERFQSGVNITPEQIKAYYRNTMLPEYARQHATPPKLETISGQIEEVLLQRQVSNLLVDWLQSLRAQGSVVVLHPGEEAP